MNSTILYHGSSHEIKGQLKPVLKHSTLDHVHNKPAVFATERVDIASLFMFPLDTLASVGFEQDVAYICIWGKPEEFTLSDKGGYIYFFSNDNFEQIGKDYEWQSFLPTLPKEVKHFKSVINGMIYCGAQVYFVDEESTMDRIVTDKDNRAPILKDLISENQKLSKNFRKFN